MAAARSHNCLDLCVDQCSAETFVAQGAATQFPKTRTPLLHEVCFEFRRFRPGEAAPGQMVLRKDADADFH